MALEERNINKEAGCTSLNKWTKTATTKSIFNSDQLQVSWKCNGIFLRHRVWASLKYSFFVFCLAQSLRSSISCGRVKLLKRPLSPKWILYDVAECFFFFLFFFKQGIIRSRLCCMLQTPPALWMGRIEYPRSQ